MARPYDTDAFVTHLKFNLPGRVAVQEVPDGSGADRATGIALGPQGTVYITGITDSATNFP